MRLLLVPIVLSLFLAGIEPVLANGHARVSTHTGQATPAQRWPTDPPLRAGMARTRAAVDALQHAEHGHLHAKQLSALASDIQRAIGFIVSNCRFEPRADVALHPILGTLAQGAQALQATPPDLSKIPAMRRAIRDYAGQFDDPVVVAK